MNQGYQYKETVNCRIAGWPVLSYLAERYQHTTAAEWRQRIDAGMVLLNDLPATPDAILQPGQSLVWRRPPWDEPEVPLSYAVLYLDQWLIAVAKPAGLPTLPAGGFVMHTLLTLVQRSYPEATPLHRLGRGTSGVVLLARTAQARKILHKAFRDNTVIKTYKALASGQPEQDEFTIDFPIGPMPHARLGLVYAASAAGRRAVSRVRVVERFDMNSLLEVKIETGRPHQIRIHLASAGHPLVGDPLYASGGRFKESGSSLALPGEIGYELHAENIAFNHPETGTAQEVYCCPPPSLQIGKNRECDQMGL